MPSIISKTTSTRDLEIPKTSSILVVYLDQSGDKAITPLVNNKDIISSAGNKTLFSLDLLLIYKGSISRYILILY
jgi:hypothetical protein